MPDIVGSNGLAVTGGRSKHNCPNRRNKSLLDQTILSQVHCQLSLGKQMSAICKKGDRKGPGNYRPNSLMSDSVVLESFVTPHVIDSM